MTTIKLDVIGSELVVWGASPIEETLKEHGWRLHTDSYFSSWRKADYTSRDIEFVMATCEDRKIEVKKGVLVEFELQDTGSGTLGEATPPESQQTNG
eukprot:287262-Rhodomonas_salina.1